MRRTTGIRFLLATLILALISALPGCATKPSPSSSSNNYEMTVTLYGNDNTTIIYQFTVEMPLDVPICVEEHPKSGKYYKVSGTLRQMPEGIFKLESGIIKTPSQSIGYSGGAGDIYLGKLGEGCGWGFVDGMVFGCGGIVLTKKTQ
jgi:hypothetical protein